ncbi:MAG: YceI family protein [Chitinophagaceae bacterium]
MKRLNHKLQLVLIFFLSGIGYMVSCTHDNSFPPPAATTGVKYTPGTAVFLPGNMTVGNVAEWKLDKVHSNCMWQTNYMGAAGLLTGRFNQFGMHDVTTAKMINYATVGQPLIDSSWAFYEGDDSKTYFNGYVQINTSNTGEPGRDAGCNVAGMGTVAIVAGTQNLTATNLAKLRTTKITFDPSTGDYLVALDLTWQGKLASPVTKNIPGKLKFIKRATITGAAPYDVFGLQLSFQFNCRDFGITSTSIGDKIEIECNMNFNNK